jgi:hypothetical protein
MNKKASHANPEKTEGKGAFYKAGEIIGTIGFHIVDGKDKALGAVSDGFSILKKVIRKKPAKKQKATGKVRKVSKKKSSGKSAGKTKKGAKNSSQNPDAIKSVLKKADKVKKIAKDAG